MRASRHWPTAPRLPDWPAERRSLVEHELRDFRLGGAELQVPAQKQRFKTVREREAEVSTRFAENVLDATNTFALYLTDRAALAGVPDDAVQLLPRGGRGGGTQRLQDHSAVSKLSAILEYADDRALREQLYRAYVTRACELGNPDWNNGPLIVELLRLRQEHARLLGYSSFAEVSLVPKMAATPAEVLHFLRDLGARARPYAERDVAEVRQFAAEELGLADVTPWDFSYASEKLREARYAFSDQELKRYFTEPRVLAGLFKVIETMFGVVIREEPTPTWHPDVRFFRIESSRGELVAQFYLDLYARDHKQGGAWTAMRAADAVAAPAWRLRCRI